MSPRAYDDEKLQFYKKATRAYAVLWFTRGKEILDALKSNV